MSGHRFPVAFLFFSWFAAGCANPSKPQAPPTLPTTSYWRVFTQEGEGNECPNAATIATTSTEISATDWPPEPYWLGEPWVLTAATDGSITFRLLRRNATYWDDGAEHAWEAPGRRQDRFGFAVTLPGEQRGNGHMTGAFSNSLTSWTATYRTIPCRSYRAIRYEGPLACGGFPERWTRPLHQAMAKAAGSDPELQMIRDFWVRHSDAFQGAIPAKGAYQWTGSTWSATSPSESSDYEFWFAADEGVRFSKSWFPREATLVLPGRVIVYSYDYASSGYVFFDIAGRWVVSGYDDANYPSVQVKTPTIEENYSYSHTEGYITSWESYFNENHLRWALSSEHGFSYHDNLTTGTVSWDKSQALCPDIHEDAAGIFPNPATYVGWTQMRAVAEWLREY